VTRGVPVRKRYPSDLTDEQWALIEPLLPAAKPGGRPRRVDLREVVNTLFYQARTGCQWDFLPHDLVPKGTAYDYFARWHDDGTWRKIVDALRGQIRTEAGRDETPSAALIDSQTVKASEIGGPTGYDGGKKIKGRKRHYVVDTLGLLLAVVVTAANLDDGTHAWRVLRKLDRDRFPRLEAVFGDSKYNNRTLDRWLARTGAPYRVEAVATAKGDGVFKPAKLRWAVERTIAWMGRCRRLSRDYEYNTSASETWVQIAAIQQMTRRLRPDPNNGQAAFKYPKKAKEAA
jgi:putative transposase